MQGILYHCKAIGAKTEMDTTCSVALKEATFVYNLPNDTLGSQKLAEHINEKPQLIDRTLDSKTLQNYKRNNMIGRSPEKRGSVARLPLPFLELP